MGYIEWIILALIRVDSPRGTPLYWPAYEVGLVLHINDWPWEG